MRDLSEMEIEQVSGGLNPVGAVGSVLGGVTYAVDQVLYGASSAIFGVLRGATGLIGGVLGGVFRLL